MCVCCQLQEMNGSDMHLLRGWFLFSFHSRLHHCVCLQHRNTGLYPPPPAASPWTCRSQPLFSWLRIYSWGTSQNRTLLRSLWTRWAPWFSPAAVWTSTSGNRWHPLCGCSLWWRCHPCFSTEHQSGWHHSHRLHLHVWNQQFLTAQQQKSDTNVHVYVCFCCKLPAHSKESSDQKRPCFLIITSILSLTLWATDKEKLKEECQWTVTSHPVACIYV